MPSRKCVAKWVLSSACAAALAAAGVVNSYAQQAPPAAAPAPAAPAQPPAWPDFTQVTKDMQAIPGLITLYRYNPQDNSKDQSRLLAAIPRGLMKQDMLLATSISKGPLAGFMWDDYLVRFDTIGRNVIIAVPDSRYVTQPGKEASEVIARTYPQQILVAMPIVTMSPTGDPVVDLGQFLTGPTVSLPGSGMFSGRGGGFGAMPRRDLSEYTKIKNFPENMLIDVNLALGTRTGGAENVGVSYALRKLPPLGGYQPRLADERVGYFTTVRQDWTMKHSERENVIRYANRWDIKKKDPSLEMSPPDKPIVFVIEKTVPLQWRRYVKEGIEEWNKAYEKIGIVGAIVVQQQTDDNEFAQVDPEDARYNFFRWVVTGSAFAMGPSRADPRTGQLLDADIIFDDAFLRVYHEEFNTFGPASFTPVLGPEMTQFLLENPGFLPFGQNTPEARAAGNNTAVGELLHDSAGGAAAQGRGAGPIASRMQDRLRSYTNCNYAAGLKHQMSVMNLAAAAGGKKLPERAFGDLIKMISAHEVGHTLGLRHNFKASSWLTMEEVKRRRDTTDEATCASVMDYLPVLYFTGDQLEKIRHFTTPCVGPYDFWAIEYGYKQATPADGNEKDMLAKIAAQNTKRELAYATDEDTRSLMSPDPLSNRFDMGADPVAWANVRTALVDALMKDIKKWAVKSGDPNHYLLQTYLTLLFEKGTNMLYVSRVPSGQYYNRNRPGDPDARPALVLVEPKQQRAALKMLAETVFRDDFFAADPELLNDLGPSRWWDWASVPASRVDFPVHSMIGSLQGYSLMGLCSPQALQRVYDAELKSKASDKFTAAELISSVRDMIWKDLALKDDASFTDAKPMVSSVRRNLQKQHLEFLLTLADEDSGRVSPDLTNMCRFALRELQEQITATLDKGKQVGENGGNRIDFGTRAHLTECRSQIDRTLNAPRIKMQMPSMGFMIYGSQPGAAPQQPVLPPQEVPAQN